MSMQHPPVPGDTIALAFVALLVLFVALCIGLTIFWIVEVVDAARRVFPDQNTKLVWILVIVFTHGIGALLYYFVGKSQGVLPGQIVPGQSPFPPGPGQFPQGPGQFPQQ